MIALGLASNANRVQADQDEIEVLGWPAGLGSRPLPGDVFRLFGAERVKINQEQDQRSRPIIQINQDRLLRRINDLAEIGRDETGGITRVGFGAADREARTYIMDEAKAAGLRVHVDAGGNILMRCHNNNRSTRRPMVLMMGSHLDSVVNGGRLDGAYGVVAALEALQALADSSAELLCEPVAVAFANEEGALFPQPFWGSMALVGREVDVVEDLNDSCDMTLRNSLEQAGGNFDELKTAAWPSGSVAAYLELHIEQGPVLEQAGKSIGIVTAITGRTVLTLEIRGRAAHAGTTPMPARADALVAASHVVLAVQELSSRRGLCQVSTVGHLEARPNVPNTIAGLVQITTDLRDQDHVRLREAERCFLATVQAIGRQTGTDIAVTAQTRVDPVPTSADLQRLIEGTAVDLGLTFMRLSSGAGHDAQIVSDIAPIAMIFVPSIRGVSHVPEEDTRDKDLIAGSQMLLATAQRLLTDHGVLREQ